MIIFNSIKKAACIGIAVMCLTQVAWAVTRTWSNNSPPKVGNGDVVNISTGNVAGMLNIPAGTTITISGSATTKTPAKDFVLNIGTGAKVIWTATYSSTGKSVNLQGEGEFEMIGGSISCSHNNGAIRVGDSTNSKVNVTISDGKVIGTDAPAITMASIDASTTGDIIIKGTGEVVTTSGGESPYSTIVTYGNVEVAENGKVTANGGRAIWAQGTSSKIIVSGGEVTNEAINPIYKVIEMANTNTMGNVIVSGTGKVISNAVPAIYTFCNVEVKDYAEVNSGIATAIYLGGANSTITVSDNAKVNSKNGVAIQLQNTNAQATVRDNALVSTEGIGGNAIAIYLGGANSIVAVSNSAKVNSKNGVAIQLQNTNARATVSDNALVSTEGIGGNAIAINALADSANIFVNGGEVRASGANSFAIRFQKTSTAYITGGKISVTAPGTYAFYLAGNNSVAFINGGEISVSNGGAEFYKSFGIGALGIIRTQTTTANNYTLGISTDLRTAGISTTAAWTTLDKQNGISYARGTNNGFIPVDGVIIKHKPLLNGTVTVKETATVISYQQKLLLTANVNIIGSNPGVLSYQWKRDGKDIPGATAQTYTLNDMIDIRRKISVEVSAANYSGSMSSTERAYTREDYEAAYNMGRNLGKEMGKEAGKAAGKAMRKLFR